MLKNFPNSNFFCPHKSAKNLNNYFPYKSNQKSKKNYKFNDLNPIHSERNINIINKTRNFKTPDRDNNSKKISNSYINLNSVNIPNSLRNPKKTESFFSSQVNTNSLLNSVRYISSPLLSEHNINNINYTNKKTLILDLDETLVHSAFYPFQKKSDIILKINIDGKNHIIHVLKRPGLDYFLDKISKLFNIIIFTASLQQYAEPLINILDKENMFKRMFRQNCEHKNGKYIKDLNQIGQNYKDIIIVDNNPNSYLNNQENGIPIITWYDNFNDNELVKLIPVLEYLSKVNDVRPFITAIVNREKNEIDFNIVKKILFNDENDKNNEETYKNISNYNTFKNIDKIDKDEDDNYLYNGKDKVFNFSYSNNDIHCSLSNMSYDEIQNEGYSNENNNNVEDNINNMNIFNNYRKCILKNKNKINLFMKTKEIFNISNNKENKLIQYENNKQIYDDDNNTNNNIKNNFPLMGNKLIEDKVINQNTNYNFIYGSGKNSSYYNDNFKNNKSFQDPNEIKQNNKNVNNNINNYPIYKESITINHPEQNKPNKINDINEINDNSFEKINNKIYQKKIEKEKNDTNTYRSHSMINKNKTKNYNLINNNKLYKKPINIKEKFINNKNNINKEKEEENKYKTNIELRRERLKEMRKKIEEINKDIKNTEDYYSEKKNKIKNRINNYNDENINNLNYDNDIKSYKAQIIDTDININDRNDMDYNVLNKNDNLFNKKINCSNINIYRNHKSTNIIEFKNDNARLNNKYNQKIEKKFYYQTPNLKNAKSKNNIYRIYSNNKSNGRANKSSNQDTSS